MEGSVAILNRVSRLISKVMDLNVRLKRENKRLLNERDRLMKDKVRLMEEVKRYKREEKVKNIYTSFVVQDGDKAKAKRQIDRILREIDDCIDSLKSKP